MTDSFFAELALLGSICIDPAPVLRDVRGIVRAEDIQDPRCRAGFLAACQLADGGESVDPVSLQQRAAENGVTLSTEFLREAMGETPTAANCLIYAHAVHDASISRAIQEVGGALAESGGGAEELRAAIAQLQALQSGSCSCPVPSDRLCLDFYNFLDAASNGQRRAFLPTGYGELDALLGGGLSLGGMTTLAARTGVGKTMLGLNVADNVAAAGRAVLYVSLEMPDTQIMARRVGRAARLSYSKLSSGVLSQGDAEWTRVTAALAMLNAQPFYLSDKPAGVTDIELKARSTPDLALIVIDHMGLIHPDRPAVRLYEQTTAVSHELKALALSLGVPVLSLCQLNREVEGREGDRPRLSDLRNSGAIEEDSDAVLLLSRPKMNDESVKPWELQPLVVDVAKNRHGQTGRVNMSFCGLTAMIT